MPAKQTLVDSDSVSVLFTGALSNKTLTWAKSTPAVIRHHSNKCRPEKKEKKSFGGTPRLNLHSNNVFASSLYLTKQLKSVESSSWKKDETEGCRDEMFYSFLSMCNDDDSQALPAIINRMINIWQSMEYASK